MRYISLRTISGFGACDRNRADLERRHPRMWVQHRIREPVDTRHTAPMERCEYRVRADTAGQSRGHNDLSAARAEAGLVAAENPQPLAKHRGYLCNRLRVH